MRKFITSILLASTFFAANAQRILGYLPDYRDVSASAVQYNKVTDIAFSFINPNTNGTLKTFVSPGDNLYSFDENKFLTAKANCNANGVNLWLAVGGADPGKQRAARLAQVTGSTGTRTTFVNELVAYGVRHSIYGFAMDWEFPDGSTQKNNHEALLRELKTAIANSSRPSMKISVAVGGETLGSVNHTQDINRSAIQYVDEFHLMMYDLPGSTGLYDANNHSSLADSRTCVQGWVAFGIPREKMLLAIPFYGRSVSRFNELEYNRMPSSNAVYNGDSWNGYYYNGRVTLEAKTEYIMEQGGLGVAIWDLGQDKSSATGYSLLDAVYTKMNSLCPAPQPNLGPDQGVCGTVNIQLDSDISSASGRSFTWYKDDVRINGASAPTYTATDNGIYKVVISQGGCAREDVMEIAAGSPLTATGDQGCPGDNMTISVNNPVGGTVYEWFDAAQGGANLGTGASINVTPNTTSTYYVQEQTDNESFFPGITGPAPGLSGSPFVWANIMGSTAQWIEVKTDLTIKSAMIHTFGGADNVKLVAVDEFGTVQGESAPVDIDNHPNNPAANWEDKLCHVNAVTTTITANISLSPGKYLLAVTGEATSALDECGVDAGIGMQSSMEITETTATYDGNVVDGEEEPGVYFLEGACHIDWNMTTANGSYGSWDIVGGRTTNDADHIHYGILFSMEIETGASSSCPRAEATAIVENCTPLSVDIVSPTHNSTLSTSEVSFDIDLEGEVQAVTYTITPMGGGNAVTVGGEATNGYDLTYAFTQPGTYTILVEAENASENASDQIEITLNILGTTESLESAGVYVYPNPTTSTFTIDADNKVNGAYTFNLINTEGVIVETIQGNGLNKLSLGESLESGIYTLQMVANNAVYVSKLIKE